jgi:putative nucleotidyltransferase with HDIG domain
MDVESARQLAEEHLAGSLPRRWIHVRAVAAAAEQVVPLVGDDAELLVSAAWLHDIGYAPDLVDTGFHPLDGARYLRALDAPPRLCGLVANHTSAIREAKLRGLAEALAAEFPREKSVTADVLWYCDLTTGPDGQHFSAPERLTEIQSRYGPEHLITQFIDNAREELLTAIQRVEQALMAQVPQSTWGYSPLR